MSNKKQKTHINLSLEETNVISLAHEGHINDILMGHFVSKPTCNQVAAATSSGKIIIIVEGQVKATLNPKSGSILALAVGSLPMSLAVGDNQGQITTFSESQILSKKSTSHPIISLAYIGDVVGNRVLVSGNSLGILSGHQLHSRLWRTCLATASAVSDSLEELLPVPSSRAITSILPLEVWLQNTTIGSYTFVLNQSCNVFLFSGQLQVAVIKFPTPIISQTKGLFDLSTSSPKTPSGEVVLFASQNEIYFIDEKFKPCLYQQTDQKIQQIIPFNPGCEQDFLLVVHLSNEVSFYFDGQSVHKLKFFDWVTKAITGDLCSPFQGEVKGPTIVFALADSTLHIFNGSMES